MKFRERNQMKERIMTVLFWFMLLIALPPERIYAQPQDPLRSTLDLLKTKLETYLSYSLSEGQVLKSTSKFEAVSFANCQIAWKSSVVQDNNISQALRNVRIINNTSVD